LYTGGGKDKSYRHFLRVVYFIKIRKMIIPMESSEKSYLGCHRGTRMEIGRHTNDPLRNNGSCRG
jgi:hypothetical protein